MSQGHVVEMLNRLLQYGVSNQLIELLLPDHGVCNKLPTIHGSKSKGVGYHFNVLQLSAKKGKQSIDLF